MRKFSLVLAVAVLLVSMVSNKAEARGRLFGRGNCSSGCQVTGKSDCNVPTQKAPTQKAATQKK